MVGGCRDGHGVAHAVGRRVEREARCRQVTDDIGFRLRITAAAMRDIDDEAVGVRKKIESPGEAFRHCWREAREGR